MTVMLKTLDHASRATVYRFAAELSFATLFAILVVSPKFSVLLTASAWLTLYAIIVGVTALRLKEKFSKDAFNRWDEVLWLLTLAQGLKLAHHIL